MAPDCCPAEPDMFNVLLQSLCLKHHLHQTVTATLQGCGCFPCFDVSEEEKAQQVIGPVAAQAAMCDRNSLVLIRKDERRNCCFSWYISCLLHTCFRKTSVKQQYLHWVKYSSHFYKLLSKRVISESNSDPYLSDSGGIYIITEAKKLKKTVQL